MNINQIKGFIDRMGGIEGVIGTMGKVQKFVGSVQQFAPMLKLMFSGFGAKAATKRANTVPAAKRKKKRKSTQTKRKSKTTKRRTRSSRR
ncbi:hypothetical protein [Paenibacillus sp. RC84]